MTSASNLGLHNSSPRGIRQAPSAGFTLMGVCTKLGNEGPAGWLCCVGHVELTGRLRGADTFSTWNLGVSHMGSAHWSRSPDLSTKWLCYVSHVESRRQEGAIVSAPC
ncbi:hypothetical protein B296_00020687 [Ensete ventricosum]|uniref:Uncharacterized protein n=1 Tax=Ensete ventricosum TaxID=4639 RepID=A0A427AUZ2_ENSVE|nr:hypothetical protein B296_00020687 [Ensete ventricosum]